MKQSPYQGGKGDLVRDFVASCRKHGIRPGIYASMSSNGYLEVDNPGLVNRGKGGDPAAQARYARTCEGLLTELWGNYGELFEIWFDGGVLDPSRGGRTCCRSCAGFSPRPSSFRGRRLHPLAGNEGGVAAYPSWATVPGPDYSGGGRPRARWLPGECDAPVRRETWLWLPDTEDRSAPATSSSRSTSGPWAATAI